MPVRMRLQRHGKKRKPFYHIVVADARSPRDGKFIERLGIYNPNVNPALIEIDQDKALTWLGNGAQPTNTVRAILSYTGVLYKKHLQRGVKKGAFSQDVADQKFTEWWDEKQSKINAKRQGVIDAVNKLSADRDNVEKEARLANRPDPAKVAAEEAKAAAEAEEAAAPAVEEKAPESKAEEKAPESKAEEKAPEPKVEEKAPEPKAEEKAPEPKAEEKAPEPKAEEKAPEPKAEEKKAEPAVDEKAAAEKKAADEKAAAEKKAADEKAAAEKKAADEKAAAEKKAADEKAAAAEKKAAEEKAAAEKKAAEEKAAAEKKAAEEKAAAETKVVETVNVAAPVVTETVVENVSTESKVTETVTETVTTRVVSDPSDDAPFNGGDTGEGDDLSKVEGIGPKIREVFAAHGIKTYATLAKCDYMILMTILMNNGLASHDPSTWPRQAELASEGKWEELKAWQDELDGGKIV